MSSNNSCKIIFYFPTQTEIYLIGEFNNWGRDKANLHKYQFNSENFPIYKFDAKDLAHKTAYLIHVDGKNYVDPRSVFFNKEMHSIFWDFASPDSYQIKSKSLNFKNKSNIIVQSDLPGLISWYRAEKSEFKNLLGQEIPKDKYYKFIAQSGIIDKIKNLGFNMIQFLPTSKSIDGDNWKFRYLSGYPFSINDDWGNPDEYREMIDAFHEQGVGIIHDAIYSHFPHKKYTMNGNFDFICNLPDFFRGDDTSWGTKRYNYADKNVRDFLVDSATHFIDDYKIDGFRIDNVDGILRFGESGDGADRPGSREFLRELNTKIYEKNPNAVVNFEAHYFKDDNAKRLIGDLDEDKLNLGATAYSSSREAFFFQSEYMIKSAPLIKVSRIKEILEDKVWGESNSCIGEFHNHDAAAGLMEGRATGSYAYDAIIRNDHHLHYHAIGKIKVMETIVSLCLEGRCLDLIQTFLMQTGTFEHDSTIHWYLEMIEANQALLNFKREINKIMLDPDFSPKEVSSRKLINVDEDNKVLVFEKGDHLIFINLSADMIPEYEFKVSDFKIKDCFELIFNSDEFKYCGSGRSMYEDKYFVEKNNMLKLGWISAYEILVFRKVD